MKISQFHLGKLLLAGFMLLPLAACDQVTPTSTPAVPAPAKSWLGIPSAVNQVITFLHESTGWLLNKSDVSVKLKGEVRPTDGSDDQWEADFQITVDLGNESFETVATHVPCDELGIPTEESVVKLREAVEEIKEKMKRLQL